MAVETVERGVEPHRFAASTHPHGLAETGPWDVRSFLGPESSTVAANPGEPDALTVGQFVNVRFPIKKRDTGGFNQPAKGHPARSAPIVIAEDRDHGRVEIAEHLVRKLTFRQSTAFRDIPGDDDEIDVRIDFTHLPGELLWNLVVQMEITDRRDAD